MSGRPNAGPAITAVTLPVTAVSWILGMNIIVIVRAEHFFVKGVIQPGGPSPRWSW